MTNTKNNTPSLANIIFKTEGKIKTISARKMLREYFISRLAV